MTDKTRYLLITPENGESVSHQTDKLDGEIGKEIEMLVALNVLEVDGSIDEYEFFDWDVSALKSDTKIKAIAKPGIVLVTKSGRTVDAKVQAMGLKVLLERTEAPKLRRLVDEHINGAKGRFEPLGLVMRKWVRRASASGVKWFILGVASTILSQFVTQLLFP